MIKLSIREIEREERRMEREEEKVIRDIKATAQKQKMVHLLLMFDKPINYLT